MEQWASLCGTVIVLGHDKAFLWGLQDRDLVRRKQGLGPKCHFFSSFFLNKLFKDAHDYCYNNVRRWTLEKRLKGQNQARAHRCWQLLVRPVRVSGYTQIEQVKEQLHVWQQRLDQCCGQHLRCLCGAVRVTV